MGLKSNGFSKNGYIHETDPRDDIKLSHKELVEDRIPVPISLKSKEITRSILKNVIIISFAFMLNFTSFQSMTNLQSSLNKQLGTTALASCYIALVLSCAFIPSWLIKKLKVKWTMVVCMLCYTLYIAAQFYPTYYTLIPAAILMGIAAAPLWSAKCTYLTQVAGIYGEHVGESREIIITKFFGIFFMILQTCQIWGNLISSTVLSTGGVSVLRTEEYLESCGANFCLAEDKPKISIFNGTSTTPIPETEYSKIVALSVIYLGIMLAAVTLIAVFVDPISKFVDETASIESKSGKELLVATFTHMLKINQILVIPLTIWTGIQKAFMQADFTAAFAKCVLGVHMVGYVMICFGTCNAIGSFCFSHLVKKIGRVPVFTFAALLNTTLLIFLSLWKPHHDYYIVFFIVAALWGAGDAIWQSQINAFYGITFPGESEAAFSNFKLWQSIGSILAFVWSSFICVRVKIYILLGIVTVGMLGYYAVVLLEKIGGLKYKSKRIITLKDFS